MQVKLTILLAASLVYAVSAMVCQKNYCETVKCASVDQNDCEVNKDGIFRERGGWCGCCPTCLYKIREGESCFSLLLRGVPPRAACDTGLHCDFNNRTCVKNNEELRDITL